MDDLAHWIMGIGTGVMIGIFIFNAAYLLVRLAEALPNRIPLITPTWEAIRETIRKLLDRLDRRLPR